MIALKKCYPLLENVPFILGKINGTVEGTDLNTG